MSLERKRVQDTKKEVVQKKMALTETLTFVHHKMEDGDKENKEDITVKYIHLITEILQ